jgi:[ribosomal protein S18]-alanine N-acetyltransferase
MLEQLFVRKPVEFEIIAMGSADCRSVAELHSARFARPWSDGEIHALLAQSTVFGFVARQQGQSVKSSTAGFVLARLAGGEAEILSIAVKAKQARLSLGWRLMQSAIREARLRGGDALFLEVDQNNLPAIGLYAKLGFAKAGERKAYYSDAQGNKSAALVMRLDLK